MSLTANGLERPRLNDLKAALDALFTEALGPVTTTPDSVVGQLTGLEAEALANLWEAVQDNYDSMYPFSAEGTALDGAVSFVGIERLPATPTTVIAMVYGEESTLLPTGVLVRSTANRQFATITDTVITRAAAGDVEITVSDVQNLANYQVITGGTSVVYTSDADATDAEIAAGLAALFDPAKFIATSAGAVLRVRAANQTDEFSVTVDSKLTITNIGSPALFVALDFGAYSLPVGALTRIDTAVIGWDAVNNLVAGDIGRFVESDEALRLRHRNSVRVTGAATAQAIRARLLQEVPEVTAANIYENRTNSTVAGMPPHSFEAIVQGGSNQAIGNKLFEVGPAGIETYGNTSVQVLDENGDLQTISFSRPVVVYAWVRVSVNLLNPEEPLTPTAAQAITDAVLAYGQTLGVGDNIIPQRFYGPIYGATAGIANITVEVAATAAPGDVPSYSTAPVDVDRAEVAEFSEDRIVVLGV